MTQTLYSLRREFRAKLKEFSLFPSPLYAIVAFLNPSFGMIETLEVNITFDDDDSLKFLTLLYASVALNLFRIDDHLQREMVADKLNVLIRNPDIIRKKLGDRGTLPHEILARKIMDFDTFMADMFVLQRCNPIKREFFEIIYQYFINDKVSNRNPNFMEMCTQNIESSDVCCNILRFISLRPTNMKIIIGPHLINTLLKIYATDNILIDAEDALVMNQSSKMTLPQFIALFGKDRAFNRELNNYNM